MTFMFELAELAPIINHARDAEESKSLYGQADTAVPGLWLVHDAGVYCMSNGNPGLLVKAGESKHKVVYAMGYDETTHIGGDDFVELIPLRDIDTVIKYAKAQGNKKPKKLTVTITPSTFSIGVD